jgi:hypothetical protein
MSLFGDAESQPLGRDVYIFIRTRLPIGQSPEFFSALGEVLGTTGLVPVLGFGKDSVSWNHGYVIRFKDCQNRFTIDGMRTEYGAPLSVSDGWAIFDVNGDFLECPAGGPMGRFFEKTGRSAFSQIYLIAAEGDQRAASALEQVKSAMRRECLPVFHFRDGQILFLDSNESAQVTLRRCESSLRHFRHWAIIDRDGRCLTAKGEDDSIWPNTFADGRRWQDADSY